MSNGLSTRWRRSAAPNDVGAWGPEARQQSLLTMHRRTGATSRTILVHCSARHRLGAWAKRFFHASSEVRTSLRRLCATARSEPSTGSSHPLGSAGILNTGSTLGDPLTNLLHIPARPLIESLRTCSHCHRAAFGLRPPRRHRSPSFGVVPIRPFRRSPTLALYKRLPPDARRALG